MNAKGSAEEMQPSQLFIIVLKQSLFSCVEICGCVISALIHDYKISNRCVLSPPSRSRRLIRFAITVVCPDTEDTRLDIQIVGVAFKSFTKKQNLIDNIFTQFVFCVPS